MTPLFFNSIRLYTGFIFVLAMYILFSLYTKKKNAGKIPSEPAGNRKPLSYQLMGGVACGLVYALGSICQQWGLYFTTAGKTGFITTMYTILVPILSWILFKKKVKRQIWAGAVLAVMGLFFIAGGMGFHLSAGDIVVFIGAIFFAMQILLTGHFVQHTSVLLLNTVQLATAGTVSLIAALFFEDGNSLSAVIDAAGIILYAGVVCIGAAYLLQGVGLKKASPSVAAIILSFESVFGAIFGAVILKESMNGGQLFGCALIFSAIIVSQFDRRSVTVKSEQQ
ncbi:DMT family transporter [Bacillota bacterium]